VILSVKNLCVSYGAIQAINNISLEVNEGETVALIGANGAGKTTILRTISGLLKSKSGSIEFLGKDLSQMKAHKIVEAGLSHVPERRGIFANLSVLENLEMGGFCRKLKSSDFDEVYSIFPRLLERRKQLAGTLSGGEQQMLAISRALLSRPKLMLLDEPSLGLAPQVNKSIFDTIQNINKKGTTVLLVEQNAFAALKISHRGYVLETGSIVLSDKSEKLLNDESVKKAYLG
jgi:branched-chain amino acid transport system ATP-binding protein